MRSLIILTVLMLLTVGSLFSYSLYENYEIGLGRRIGNLDARGAGMGGTGTAGGINVLDNYTNPANLGFIKKGLSVQLVNNIVMLEENRSLAMFNFFDSYVADATYASNNNFFHNFALAAAYRYNLDNFSFTAAFDYKPFTVFDGKYEEQVRNNEGSDYDSYPPILAKNYMDSEGAVYSMGPTFAVSYNTGGDMFNKIALGLSLGILRGDHTLRERIIWSDYSQENAGLVEEDNKDIYHVNRDYEGNTFSIGVRTEVNPRFDLGFNYTPSFKLNMENNLTKISSDYNYPAVLRGGVLYKPRNALRTNFAFDMEYVKWADVSEFYENVVNYYVGVEHVFQYVATMRLGFNYVTAPLTPNTTSGFVIPGPIVSPGITTGLGFNIYKSLSMDVSGEFSSRKYQTLDLFPDSVYDKNGLWNGTYRPQNRTEPDTVREYLVEVKSSLSFKW